VCWKSEERIEPGSAEKFIKGTLLKLQHLSVIEHAVATVRFVCDRGVSHEMVRHRIASFSQESTRYANYAKAKFDSQITVIEPPGLSGVQRATWIEAMEAAERAYLSLIASGAKPQIARAVLPTCLKTEIVVTANLREWMHIFELRCSPAAHPQIREVMLIARSHLTAVYPELFPSFVVEDVAK
jgi:thymidylate synthase (FAD)